MSVCVRAHAGRLRAAHPSSSPRSLFFPVCMYELRQRIRTEFFFT